MARDGFRLRSLAEVYAFAFVAAHGATDVDLGWACLLAYGAAALLPRAAVAPAFYALSLVHFAADLGVVGSAALLWSAFLVASLAGRAAAARLVFAFLLLCHTPHHYWRCWAAGRRRGLLAAAAGTLAAAACLRDPGRRAVALGERPRRVVIAHAVNELLLAAAG